VVGNGSKTVLGSDEGMRVFLKLVEIES